MKRTGLRRPDPEKVSEWRARSKPMGRSPLKKRNDARKKARFQEEFGGAERIKFVREFGCVICGFTPSEVAHARSRGAGGKAKDTLPLCFVHHRQQHVGGVRSFEEGYNVNLKAEAERIESQWQRRNQ